MKKFTVPCIFGSQKAPFDVYIGDSGSSLLHPLHFQAAWLAEERGGEMPLEVMESFLKLRDLAVKNSVSLEDLAVYALNVASGGEATPPPPLTSVPASEPESLQLPLAQRQTQEALEASQEALLRKSDIDAADNEVSIMVLVRGTLATEDPFWAYLAIPPSKYLAFKSAESKGGYAMSDYGNVVEIGVGAIEPPDDIKQRMEREFNVNHSFEAELKKKADDLQAKERILLEYQKRQEKGETG